jgi:ABC-type spermidine/putrescine transport system permease subunit I
VVRQLYDSVWIAVAAVLSLVVAIVGYPAFEQKFGFPQSLFWAFACVAGVWPTYLIRAYLWSDHEKKGNKMNST